MRWLLLSALICLQFAANSLRLPLTRLPRPQLTTYDSKNVTLEDHIIYYAVPIFLGTPPQQFDLLVDTGSSITWVGAEDCHGMGAVCAKPHYLPELSETGEDLGETFEIAYGMGEATGSWWNDSFGLLYNQSLLDSFQFGLVHLTTLPALQGILGLSHSNTSRFPTLLDAFLQNKVFTPPQFTVWLGDDGEREGSILFGGGHEDSCEETLVTVPTLDSDGMHWAFEIDSITTNGQTLNNTRGITDTGATPIVIPPEYFNSLFGHLENFTLTDQFLCTEPPADLRISFEIGGHLFEYETEDLLIPLNMGFCQWGVYVMDTDGMGWVLGDVFIRRYCQIHNYADRTVGFAKAIHRKIGD